MPRFLFTALLLSLVLSGCAASAPTTPPPGDDPPSHLLWRVDGGDNAVYLLGSVHLLRPDVYPLPAKIEVAYADADQVVFELDLDAVQAEAMTLMQAGTYADGRTLAGVLGDSLWQRVETAAGEVGLPAPLVQRMEPWLASMMLSAMTLQRAGFADSTGLDAHFFARARRDGKPRRALETLAQQIAVFDTMSPEAQAVSLRQTLDELVHLPAQMDTLTALWQAGDLDALEAATLDELMESEEAYQALLVTRNQLWLPQLEAMLEGEANTLVIVGALHLLGPDGVVVGLREAGYSVERL